MGLASKLLVWVPLGLQRFLELLQMRSGVVFCQAGEVVAEILTRFPSHPRPRGPVGVEPAGGKEPAASQPFDQRCRAAQIAGLLGQQTEVDQVAERVGQPFKH